MFGCQGTRESVLMSQSVKMSVCCWIGGAEEVDRKMLKYVEIHHLQLHLFFFFFWNSIILDPGKCSVTVTMTRNTVESLRQPLTPKRTTPHQLKHTFQVFISDHESQTTVDSLAFLLPILSPRKQQGTQHSAAAQHLDRFRADRFHLKVTSRRVGWWNWLRSTQQQ